MEDQRAVVWVWEAYPREPGFTLKCAKIAPHGVQHSFMLHFSTQISGIGVDIGTIFELDRNDITK